MQGHALRAPAGGPTTSVAWLPPHVMAPPHPLQVEPPPMLEDLELELEPKGRVKGDLARALEGLRREGD